MNDGDLLWHLIALIICGVAIGYVVGNIYPHSALSVNPAEPSSDAQTYCTKVLGGSTTAKTTDGTNLCLLPSGYAKEFVMIDGSGYEVKEGWG
jgi:hypothetical protein